MKLFNHWEHKNHLILLRDVLIKAKQIPGLKNSLNS